jgi:uncharacterized protein
MKNHLYSILLLTALFLEHKPVIAQETGLSNTLLWEISGNGLKKSSYLFGTIHLICEKDFVITEKVKKAFEKTDRLALEIDFDDPSELQDMQKLLIPSTPLSVSLSKLDYQKLDSFLVDKMGTPLKQMENYDLSVILSQAMVLAAACPTKSFELEFVQMAHQRKIPIEGLEKIAFQLNILKEAFSDTELIEQLPFFKKEYFEEMTQLYLAENLEKLFTFINDPQFMNDKSKTIMLHDRNKNWVQQMPSLMQSHSVFFAVGAAHLPGPEGVIKRLQQAGYTLSPVLE